MGYNKGKNNPNYRHGQYIKNIYYWFAYFRYILEEQYGIK
jgi:hypothetical protein